MNIIKVNRPFRGLHEGDELVYNKETNMFELRETDEVISENFQSKNTRLISFSPNFVEKFLGQVFEDVNGFFAEEELPTACPDDCECKEYATQEVSLDDVVHQLEREVKAINNRLDSLMGSQEKSKKRNG